MNMKGEDILEQDDFKRCVDFHGHICPGIAIGYRAARAGLDWLDEGRASDEELVAVVETDACSVDAIQVLSGCTFGKGNFFCKDYGKQAFTFMSRGSGKGVRLALRSEATQLPERHKALLDRIRAEKATEEERAEYQELHLQRARHILTRPLEILFTVTRGDFALPEMAKVEPSRPCEACGEPTMGSKLVEIDGRYLCGGCTEALSAVS
jgi:formylmethanofuran dehydrogenase subunit E